MENKVVFIKYVLVSQGTLPANKNQLLTTMVCRKVRERELAKLDATRYQAKTLNLLAMLMNAVTRGTKRDDPCCHGLPRKPLTRKPPRMLVELESRSDIYPKNI